VLLRGGIWLLAPEKKRIIAIIDDDEDISKLFKIVLGEKISGYDIHSFNDPIVALEHFTRNKNAYALVMTDLRMTGLSGLELLKKVKEANPRVRTILASAYDFEGVKSFQEYVDLGIIDLSIEKPISVQRLCDRVRDEIQIYQLAN
jgi:DNA-binding NtrC family response regulator